MIKRNIKLLILCSVFIIIGGVIFYNATILKGPLSVIDNKTKLKLPASVKVVNYDYNKKTNRIGAKIQFDEKDFKYIKDELDINYNHKLDLTKIALPNFEKQYTWWELYKHNIQCGYSKFIDNMSVSGVSTYEEWIFISKDNNGQCYLFIADR